MTLPQPTGLTPLYECLSPEASSRRGSIRHFARPCSWFHRPGRLRTDTGVRGAIVSTSGDNLVVKTNRGAEQAIKLDKDTRVAAISLANINDIKPGSYIGAAAIPQPDGSQKALEVHVFPPALAGTGDGHRPFDLAPNSTMTNGTVGDVVASNGRTLTLKYKGGEKKIVVPEDVPIVNIEAGDRSLLVVGAKVVVRARKNPDGSLTAVSISAGKNGVAPPM
jgi:RNase P/RNase MRP subunit p29